MKVSKQVLKELEVLRKDTIEINDNPTIISATTTQKSKQTEQQKYLQQQNNSKKQSNELNINETIEERLTKLERKVKHMLIETCDEIKKKAQ